MLWNSGDIVLVLVLLTGLTVFGSLLFGRLKRSKYKWVFVLALIGILALLWVELGVGILGSSFAGS